MSPRRSPSAAFMLQRWSLILVAIVFLDPDGTEGHGIFWEPPSRASLGSHSNNMCNLPDVNYDHMSLWCGGINAMHFEHGGRCAICGDGYEEEDRPHEVPGKYATGIIGRSYLEPGQTIEVIIDMVANHGGFFQFNLCVNNDPNSDPDQDCFREHPLRFSDGELQHHTILDHRHDEQSRIYLEVVLPEGLTCWQCILQWTWVTGNRWGIGPQTADFYTEDCVNDPEGKVGCGIQETFRGCADICIGPKCSTERCQVAKPFDDSAIAPSPSPTVTTTSSSIPDLPDQICTDSEIRPNFWSAAGDNYCKVVCIGHPMEHCNLYLCTCTTTYFKE